MQGLTNAAPPSGGLRIIRQGTYTVTEPLSFPLSSQPLFAIVSALSEEEVSMADIVSTAVIALGDVVAGSLTDGPSRCSVNLRQKKDGTYSMHVFPFSTSITIQYTVFG